MYFLTTLFILSVFLTLESVTNASEEDNEIELEVSETITETPAATIVAAKNVRKGFKLNAKQVLMLNQIIGGFTLDGVQDPLCKNHTMVYKQALRQFKPWALKSAFQLVCEFFIFLFAHYPIVNRNSKINERVIFLQ